MTLYCQQRNFFGELLPIVIFLKRSYQKAARRLMYYFKLRRYLFFEPEVIIFDQKSVQELKNLKDVRLVPLYPLCDISPKKIITQAPEWVAEIQQEKQLSAQEKTNIVALLGGFISHRIKKLTLKDINQLLGGFKMEETQVGKDLIEIGIEKGKQQTLLNLLSYKFGKIPEDIINQINSISDETKLDDLATKILELTDLDQLKRILN